MDFIIQNQKDTRSGFGEGLLEAGRRNPKVVAFCADLTGSLKMGDFAKEFPERFFQTGIAEANMIHGFEWLRAVHGHLCGILHGARLRPDPSKRGLFQ